MMRCEERIGLVTFTVPGHPVPAVRMTQKSKWYGKAKRYLDYKERVGWYAKEAGIRQIRGPAQLVVRVYVRPSHQGDWDNYGKTVSDALNGVAWEDDRQVRRATVEIIPVRRQEEERVEIEVREEAG